MPSDPTLLTLELAIGWAKSGDDWEKVYRFLFLHPEQLFSVPHTRRWPIAHQIVYHGNVDLLQRVLTLYYDDEIDIRTPAGDGMSLLDVAKAQSETYPAMHAFVERLFLQDDLNRKAKEKSWTAVREMLAANPTLANKKPPYATGFLLHYLVQDAPIATVKSFLNGYEFHTDVRCADNETPTTWARRSGRADVCAMLEPPQDNPLEPALIPLELASPTSLSLSNSASMERSPSPLIPPLTQTTSTSSLRSIACPYPLYDPFPAPDFENNFLELDENGNFTVAPVPFSSEGQTEIPRLVHRSSTPTSPTALSQELTNHSQPFGPSDLNAVSDHAPRTSMALSSTAQLLKNLTCPLTQELFIDPVTGSDGQTYERSAITDWLNTYQCSPRTGASMDATFVPNDNIKLILQMMTML